ncbi:MAG: hypothetical protein J6K12_00570 [Clostridia bacterium]|nr:hypothetical protein [Clostridia bacterium]
MNNLNDKDDILEKAIKKYALESNICPQQINGLIREMPVVKQKILSLSKQEQQILLDKVDEKELSHLKKILGEVDKS